MIIIFQVFRLNVLVCVCSILLRTESSPSDETITLFNGAGYVRGFRTPANASDFHLGLLLDVYSARSQSDCNYLFTSSSPKFVEAFLFSIDKINSHSDLLPNLTLGFDIRDYCGSEVLAINETLEWIQCSAVSETCSLDQEALKGTSKFTGIVGAEASFISIPVASFLRVFSVPQVSYLSSSTALSDKYLFPYFLRTVPPDSAQAEVIMDLVNYFGWKIVSAVHSDNVIYRDFLNLAVKSEVCIDADLQIHLDLSEDEFAEIANRLVTESFAEVVVIFSLANPAAKLLREIDKLQTQRRFTWVASDAVAIETTLHNKYGGTISGMLGVTPFTRLYPDFDEYFTKLTPTNNIRNPWFAGYYEQILNVSDSSKHSQNFNVPLVVDATYSIAHGLDDFLRENCHQPLVWNRTTQTCDGQTRELNGTTLHEYIRNVTFLSPTNRTVFFDSHGDGEAVYNVFNLQYNGSAVNNVRVGKWDPVNRLVLGSPQNLQFGLSSEEEIINKRSSECTSCDEGSAQVQVPTSCCKYCTPCLGNTYLDPLSPDVCLECDQFMWGITPLNGSTSCVAIEEVFLNFSAVWGIVLVLLALGGLVLLTTVLIGIIIFWNNRVIKSFGREQLVIILIGLGVCFVLPFLYLVKPSPPICALQQFGLWFAMTLIFAALLVKLIRVTRIFLSPVAGGKRCIASWQQVVFTILIVFGQVVLVAISLIVVHPEEKKDVISNSEDSNNFPQILITCEPPHIAMLALHIIYETTLIILINGFGIFTIRFPENFNESKYIAFSTFAVGVVWMAFIPTYFSTDSNKQLQAATVVLALMIMAFCIIFCLLLPRLYFALRSKAKTDASLPSKETATEFQPSTKQKDITFL